MDNVIEFPQNAETVDGLLEQVKGTLDCIIIVGVSKDGEIAQGASINDISRLPDLNLALDMQKTLIQDVVFAAAMIEADDE